MIFPEQIVGRTKKHTKTQKTVTVLSGLLPRQLIRNRRIIEQYTMRSNWMKNNVPL